VHAKLLIKKHIIYIIIHYIHISIAYLFLFRFFQETFEADGEVVGVIFFNLDAIQKYQHEIVSVKIAGVDGTFKTVPKRPPQFNKGCLLTFHVLFKNVVS